MGHKYDEADGLKMADNFAKKATDSDIENVKKNMDKMNKGPLAKIWDKVTLLWKAFNSKETPAYAKAMIIGGLIYMVSPIDLIPDAIPILGLTDDVSVLTLVFSKVIAILPKALIAGGIASSVIYIAHLTKKNIAETAKQKNKDAISAQIESFIKKGDVNIVNVGLFDEVDQKIDSCEIQFDTIDEEIEEGEMIELRI